MLQLPVPAKTPVTALPLVPLVVQAAGVVELNTTGLPDAPPDAESVQVPPTSKLGLQVTGPMAWLPLPTVNVCVVCGASL